MDKGKDDLRKQQNQMHDEISSVKDSLAQEYEMKLAELRDRLNREHEQQLLKERDRNQAKMDQQQDKF